MKIIPPHPPLAKGGIREVPLWKRGIQGDFQIKKGPLFLTFCCLFPVSCFLFPVGCQKKEAKTQAEKAINVKVQAAEKRPLRPFMETIGSLNPYEEVMVSAEVDGILKDVRADEGTVVSKGTVLAAIDDTDYRLEVKRAEAALRQAGASRT
jgi:multidrug efflux pump subunit AcrA (membrane-fusion protein)